MSVCFFRTDRCSCREAEVNKYQKKLSGPILDRIDLKVEMKQISTDDRFAETTDESPNLWANVNAARECQAERFEGTGIPFNALISSGDIRGYCGFSAEGFGHYRKVVDQSVLSTRCMDRLAKVARTVADLVDSEQVVPEHVETAAAFVVRNGESGGGAGA